MYERLPSRRERKRGRGRVTVVKSRATGPGPVLRSRTGLIAIPLDAAGPWEWLWYGVPCIAAAAMAGLYVGWRYSDDILHWLERWLGLT